MGAGGPGTCAEASAGVQDVCRATRQDFCCTTPGGQVATYTERVFPARSDDSKGGSRFCIGPADFFTCLATRCVDKGQKCA